MMLQPPAKRLKISRGEDDYMPGSIIEIELYNFMTFNHLKCKPGSRLNLVIGPNGSGKSSIVCAIALGLGGEPQLLGRATNIGAFVKRGEESGYIKITLRGETKEEQIAIMRRMDTRNKSEWLFNGKVAPKKEVSEIIQRFNIQVNNLTQFLPQDRVCEFAKLTPVQLLEETEKAIGDTQLPAQHRALVEKSREIKNIERAVEKNGDTLNQLKALNAELEKDVERVRQREILLAKAESMKKKLPWLKYDIKKVEYIELKDKENDAKKKLDEAATTLNGLKEPIETHKKEKAVVDAKSKKISNIMNNNTRKRIELLDNENHLGVEVQGKYKEMGDLRKQEESRQQRIIQAKEELVAAELELQNLRPYCVPREDIERLASQIMDLELSANQKRLSKTESEKVLAQKRIALRQCLDRLKDMESKHTKLLQALENSGADKISDAYHWLQEHRHDFNKEVYGPILLEVNVSNQIHADYLESQTPYYIWKSFVTQDSNDRDLLVKCFKSFDVPILNYVDDEGRRKEKFEITEEMRKLGIYSRLDQVFDAPNSVKEVLISQFGLDRSYIGSKETDQKADAVSKYGILDFWTPENHYHWSVSRYGDHMTGNVEPVERSRLLLCNKDVGEIDGLRSRKSELEESVAALEESHKSFQIEIRNIENETAKLRKQREDIISIVHQEKRKRREMENRINQRKKKLESMTQEEDLETCIAKLNNQAAGISIQRFRCAIEIKNLLVDTVSHRRSFAQQHLSSIEFDAKIRDMEFNMKKQEKDAMQASLHLENCKKEVEDCRKQLSVAKRHAESIAVITPELKKDFLEMPTTIEELETAIQDNISQANSILFLNHNILEEYEHRQSQIRSIATKLETDQEELKRRVTEVDDLKKNWLPTLRNLVTQINETFSRNFQEMAVAGEVSLDEHGMDFDKFGILIKVKFRQSGLLQVLSAHHQSGGERSVSTILYLVSLQDLTKCPFRVVDEINQGMDPINERKMFQQLVRAASQPNTPQCFLLTPKLLPDLVYSEACSILNIMNGPWIEHPSKVWSSGDCWATVTGLVGESRS